MMTPEEKIMEKERKKAEKRGRREEKKKEATVRQEEAAEEQAPVAGEATVAGGKADRGKLRYETTHRSGPVGSFQQPCFESRRRLQRSGCKYFGSPAYTFCNSTEAEKLTNAKRILKLFHFCVIAPAGVWGVWSTVHEKFAQHIK